MGSNSSPYPNSIVISGNASDVAATNFALVRSFILFLTFYYSVQLGEALARPCPGEDFKTFFSAYLEDAEVQKEYSYTPIVYVAFDSPVWAELVGVEKLPMYINGRILPKVADSKLTYKINLHGKYVDVDLYSIPNTIFNYTFTYEKNGSCWYLTTMREYE